MNAMNATLSEGANAMMPEMMMQMRMVPPQHARPDAAAKNNSPEMDENPFGNDTTLMLRNLPNKITQRRLMDRLEAYRYAIDFLYLPTDFKNKCNLGYAFVNFAIGGAAAKFFKEFDGSRMLGFRRSQKVLAVQPARIQGLAANVRRFRNSSVMGVLEDEEKPLLFRDGVQVPFPKPDGPLPPVGPRYARDVTNPHEDERDER
jgi:hypothetical protein